MGLRMKVKFANMWVPVGELVKGSVVVEYKEGQPVPYFYHLKQFRGLHHYGDTIEITVEDNVDTYNFNSAQLHWVKAL